MSATRSTDRVDLTAAGAGRSTRSGPLSRERVLAAALAIADAEGLPAVTMRRVGAELGVEAMSLYHHLPGKDGLMDGLVESVIGEIVAGAPSSSDADWRADLRGRILAARRVMLHHPWAPGLIGTRPAVPPVAYTHYEAILATLIRGGFSYHLGHRALHSLGTMTLGYSPQVFDVEGTDAADEAAAEDLARLAEHLPHIVAMVTSELHDATDPTLGWCDSQSEFEFTLDLLLDGLERARTP